MTGDGPSAAAEVEFALVVERGPLEAQALLLLESLRRFGGAHAGAHVTAASPRPARRPSRATLRALRELGAEYVALDLASACPRYPTSWRVHVMAELERRAGPDVMVQLDSDTLFVADVGPICAATKAAARPVDVKGMCTSGPGDPFEPYWSALCGLAGIGVDALPWLRSTVDGQTIRASHNAGFVAARRGAGLFSRTDEVFRLSVQADLRPHLGRGLNVMAGTGEVGLAGSEWWGSSQAAASVAAASLGITVAPLDERMNVPVHLWDALPSPPARVTHVHYHHLLSAPLPQPNRLLDGSVELGGEASAWLHSRVPLDAGTRRVRPWSRLRYLRGAV